MDLIDFLLRVELVVGILVGLAAAGLVHWFAPPSEPLLVEAGLVALGFIGGVVFGSLDSSKRRQK
jgi:hypothetical protein